MMNGLSGVNVELTSRCNKGDGSHGSGCWMCGRRKLEREHPEKCNWGDMPLGMVQSIAKQIPAGVFVQLHWNGEPTLYPRLGEALRLFEHTYTGFDTNGKLLMRKSDEIIGNIDTLTVSVIQDDPEQEEQFEIVNKFLIKRRHNPPIVIFRMLGEIVLKEAWESLANEHDCVIATRTLHSPDMSKDYEKPVTIPETGVCQEVLHKLAVDRFGNVSICVRFDPEGKHIIGNINDRDLEEIWNSESRKEIVSYHITGDRYLVPLCAECDYWGVPIG